MRLEVVGEAIEDSLALRLAQLGSRVVPSQSGRAVKPALDGTDEHLWGNSDPAAVLVVAKRVAQMLPNQRGACALLNALSLSPCEDCIEQAHRSNEIKMRRSHQERAMIGLKSVKSR